MAVQTPADKKINDNVQVRASDHSEAASLLVLAPLSHAHDAHSLPSPAVLVMRPADVDTSSPPRLALGIAPPARTSAALCDRIHHPPAATTVEVRASRLD
jgi:hypothetical protein